MAVLKSLVDKVIHRLGVALYNHGIFCATHAWFIIYLAILIGFSLSYPVVYGLDAFLNRSLLASLGETPSPMMQSWVHTHPILKESVVTNITLKDWMSRTTTKTIGNDTPLIQLYYLELEPPSHWYTTYPHGVFHKQFLLETLQLEKSILNSFKSNNYSISSYCIYHADTDQQCAVGSPLEFWNHDEKLLQSDSSSIKILSQRLFNDSSSNTGFRGVKFDPKTGQFLRATSVILTFAMKANNDPAIAKAQLEEWDTFWKTWARNFNKSTTLQWRINKDSKSAPNTRFFTVQFQNFENFVELWILILSYVMVFLYVSLSLGRMELVKSKFGLGFAAVAIVSFSLLISLSIADMLGFKFTLVPWEILPYILIVVGVETTFFMTNSVVSTSIDLPVRERIGLGLRNVGFVMITSMSIELMILVFGLLTGIPALQEFCAFATIVVILDFVLHMTFFVAVLSIDIRRLELSDLQDHRVQRVMRTTSYDGSPTSQIEMIEALLKNVDDLKALVKQSKTGVPVAFAIIVVFGLMVSVGAGLFNTSSQPYFPQDQTSMDKFETPFSLLTEKYWGSIHLEELEYIIQTVAGPKLTFLGMEDTSKNTNDYQSFNLFLSPSTSSPGTSSSSTSSTSSLSSLLENSIDANSNNQTSNCVQGNCIVPLPWLSLVHWYSPFLNRVFLFMFPPNGGPFLRLWSLIIISNGIFGGIGLCWLYMVPWFTKNKHSRFARTNNNHTPSREFSSYHDGNVIYPGWIEGPYREITLSAHSNDVECFDVSTDRPILCSGSLDETIHVWDLTNGKLLNSLKNLNAVIWQLSVYKEILVVGFSDGKIGVYNYMNETLLKTLARRKKEDKIDRSRNGNRNEEEPSAKRVSQAGVTFLRIDSTGQFILAGYNDNVVCCWELQTANCLRYIDEFRGAVNCCEINENYLVIGSEDGTVRVFTLNEEDAWTGLPAERSSLILRGHVVGVTAVLLLTLSDNSAKGTYGDGVETPSPTPTPTTTPIPTSTSISLMPAVTSTTNNLLAPPPRPIPAIVANTSGRKENVRRAAVLVSGGSDGTIKIWNLASGECISTLKRHHHGAVTQLAFDSIQTRLISSGMDERLCSTSLCSEMNWMLEKEISTPTPSNPNAPFPPKIMVPPSAATPHISATPPPVINVSSNLMPSNPGRHRRASSYTDPAPPPLIPDIPQATAIPLSSNLSSGFLGHARSESEGNLRNAFAIIPEEEYEGNSINNSNRDNNNALLRRKGAKFHREGDPNDTIEIRPYLGPFSYSSSSFSQRFGGNSGSGDDDNGRETRSVPTLGCTAFSIVESVVVSVSRNHLVFFDPRNFTQVHSVELEAADETILIRKLLIYQDPPSTVCFDYGDTIKTFQFSWDPLANASNHNHHNKKNQ